MCVVAVAVLSLKLALLLEDHCCDPPGGLNRKGIHNTCFLPLTTKTPLCRNISWKLFKDMNILASAYAEKNKDRFSSCSSEYMINDSVGGNGAVAMERPMLWTSSEKLFEIVAAASDWVRAMKSYSLPQVKRQGRTPCCDMKWLADWREGNLWAFECQS